MGRYRVFYFEDLNRGEVIIGCPVCEGLKRNFIEPVVVILREESYERFKTFMKKVNLTRRDITAKNLSTLLGNLILDGHFTEHTFLNKRDLVCIFHQKKEETEHWEEDTRKFREWNERTINLTSDNELTAQDIENLDKNNLIYQFWRRIRTYRFAVDYKDLWERVGKDWESFKDKLKDKVDLEEIKKEKPLIELYLRKIEKEKLYYDFHKTNFPVFFIYEHNFLRQKEKDKFLRTKLNQNFWFKDEALIFENKTDFSKATFRDEIYFNKVVFQDGVDFVGNIFENNAVFIENKFKKTCDF
ncbi:pentapeptide repeat-containing protein, partial [Persephonella sp.]